MLNRKATWAWADALYWFFYIPLTLVVIVAIIVVPSSVLNNKVQPTAVDAAIMNERILGLLIQQPLGVIREGGQIVVDPTQSLSSVKPYTQKKKFGIRVNIGQKGVGAKQYSFNQETKNYYIATYRLADAGYPYYYSRTWLLNKDYDVINLDIDQIYPPRYEE